MTEKITAIMSKLTIVRYFIELRWLHKYPSRARLRAYQDRMINRHVAFLRRTSPYFKDIPKVTSVNELSRLPVMDKQIMMDNFGTMNTVGLDGDEALAIAIKSEKTRDFTQTYDGISVGLSSGTSGRRGLFVVSDHERYAWAGTVLAKFLPKGKLFGHRVAFFLRADNNLYETVGSHLIKFQYFDIYKDMDANCQQLSVYKPTILVAPPSVLSVIADNIDAGELQIAPKKVISVAEVLDSRDEDRFKAVFRQDIIFQAYQCTEGFLAYTCHEGGMHLNEDMAVIEKERIDKHRFIPIITDFRRISQPIIRYRLNDILVESTKACPCGSVMTLIDRIEGREDDIFIFKNSAKKEVRVYSDMIGRCMLYANGFYEYRVVQTGYNKIVVYIDRMTDVSKTSIKKEFDQLARRLSFESPHMTFKKYNRDLSKKLKRIERKFK